MLGGSLLKLLPVAAVGTAAAGGPQELMEMAEAALGATLSVKTEAEMRNIVHIMRLDLVADEPLPSNDRELAEYIEYNIDTQGTDVTKDSWGTSFTIKNEDGSRILVSCGPDTECGTEDDLERTIVNREGRFRR